MSHFRTKDIDVKLRMKLQKCKNGGERKSGKEFFKEKIYFLL